MTMALPMLREGVVSRDATAARSAHAGARIHLKTYGCSHNASDSEHMAGLLAQAGFVLVEDIADADLVILNSCTVKGPSQDSFLSLVRKVRESRQPTPLLVAGCVPQADRDNAQLRGVAVLGVQEIGRVVEAVERTLDGETPRLLSRSVMPRLDLPKLRRNKHIEIIPINLGCLNACTYCKTKHARGALRSYPPDAILSRVRSAIADGVSQVWLTSEDSGAYGRDIGVPLPRLLHDVIAELERAPRHVMLRLGMTNPHYIEEHLDEVARILRHPNVFSFIHVPVQSGSDAVLRAMRRGYTVAQFQRVVDTLRSRVPGLTVATDIICGYPTETDEDFQKTLELVRANAFPILHISQFYPRPGTAAARLPRLPGDAVKARSSELTRVFKSQLPYAGLVGTTQRVWLSDIERGRVIGHTKSYVLALTDLPPDSLGCARDLAVVAAGKHFIRMRAADAWPGA